MSALTEHLAALGYKATHPQTVVPAGYVEGIEAALGCRLPPDYLDFLAAYPLTGGLPGDGYIECRDADGAGLLLSWSELFGYEAKATWGLVPVNREYPDHRIDDMIIIGNDGFGNFFYMATDGSEGAVYFKDRDRVETAIRADLQLVRGSFADFILASHRQAPPPVR